MYPMVSCHDVRCLCVATVATHAVVIFYAKKFQWGDLLSTSRQRTRYSSQWTILKAALCLVLTWFCLKGLVSSDIGAKVTLILALPQLYRMKGRGNQQLRAVMGPLTPILAINNICVEPSPVTFVAGSLCFSAFVVLRPDNTAVVDLFKLSASCPRLNSSKSRRQLHGKLAAGNAILALITVVSGYHFKWKVEGDEDQ